MNEKISCWAVWILPIAAGAFIFGPALMRGESLFLRVAWDPNNVLSFYPWNVFSAREFARGMFPLWNPHNACGVPHLANWQSAPLYPLHLLLFLHPNGFGFDIFYIARLALLAIGTFLAARELGTGRTAAICAATAATFSGYFMAYGPMVHVNVEALFPWALWLVVRQKERWRIYDWVGLMAIFSCGYLGGNGESAFYLVFLTIAWALWLWFAEGKKVFLATIGAAAGGLLIAAPQLLPFIEYFVKAWHIHPQGAGWQFLNGAGMYSILFAVSGWNGGFFIPYFGAAALLLAVVGATSDKRAFFFLLASAFIFGLVYDMPGLEWVTRLPIFSRMASYKYALAPLAVMVAILAGRGIDGISKGEILGGRVRRASLAVGIFAASFPLGAWIDGRHFNYNGAALALISLGAVALAVSALKQKAAPAMALIIAVELIVNAHHLGMKPLLDPKEFSERPEIRYLASHPGQDRVACNPKLFPPNLNLIAGFDDINLFDALYPVGYFKQMAKALHFDEYDGVEYFKAHGYSFPITPKSEESSVWQDLGVKYYLREDIGRTELQQIKDHLWEDPNAISLLYVDGKESALAVNREGQDLMWRSDAPVGFFLTRLTRLPGWRAWADGMEVPVSEWGGLFMVLKLKVPAREIRLRYMPYGWRLGLWVGITSMLYLISVLVYRATYFS